jgi:hypothetical protein
MIWDGETILVLWGWVPDTKWSVKWHQLSSGNWRGSDRGAGEDVYESNVTFAGSRADLVALETVLDDNRNLFDATFEEGEQIFGADVDYDDSMQVTVVSYGKISQLAFDKWGMSLKLRLRIPSLITTFGSLDCLRLSSFVSSQYSEFGINKIFTYDGEAIFTDTDSDPGFFEGEFTQTTFEMKQIRRYILSNLRNGVATPFPSFGGITTPFGSREGTGPFDFRIIDWQDLGRVNLCDWKIRIKFAREF